MEDPFYGLTPARIDGLFYGFTYAMIWALPPAGLYLAIRDKDRAFLDVSLVMMLATLLTNKAYLGWPRHEWDPILLGVFLMAAAVAVPTLAFGRTERAARRIHAGAHPQQGQRAR